MSLYKYLFMDSIINFKIEHNMYNLKIFECYPLNPCNKIFYRYTNQIQL
jgi:hypothetical protein